MGVIFKYNISNKEAIKIVNEKRTKVVLEAFDKLDIDGSGIIEIR